MSDSVRVTCPCCGATLGVDGTSGEVLSHESPKTAPKSFDQALGEVHSGGKRREQAFSKAFDRTRKLEDLLDKKFEEARKKAADDTSPPRNPFDSE
jgi:hypothetical protein